MRLLLRFTVAVDDTVVVIVPAMVVFVVVMVVVAVAVNTGVKAEREEGGRDRGGGR